MEGGTIVSPLGDVIAGPLYDQEGMLFADLDLDEIVRSEFDFDAVGHYARPDVCSCCIILRRARRWWGISGPKGLAGVSPGGL